MGAGTGVFAGLSSKLTRSTGASGTGTWVGNQSRTPVMTAGIVRDGQAAKLRLKVQVVLTMACPMRAEAWTGARRFGEATSGHGQHLRAIRVHPPAGVVGFGASNHGSLL